ncbi:MAG: response regulator transcription factor [Acidobacteria bacterium]|nr:response regulator transcription factor [Acidobacteriota bacterium]
MANQILIIDDDAELCGMVKQQLEPQGFTFNCVRRREQALAHVTAGNYALILLDVALPGMDGFEMLGCLRLRAQAPVLIVTARGSAAERIRGLELGADDYLTKPCDQRELMARIHALLRRVTPLPAAAPEQTAPAARLAVGDLELEQGARLVRCAGKLIATTPAEFDLLLLLALSAGASVSREELSLRVNGRSANPFDRSIDMHVCNLRKKLGPAANGLERIRAVRGVGYFLTRALGN